MKLKETKANGSLRRQKNAGRFQRAEEIDFTEIFVNNVEDGDFI